MYYATSDCLILTRNYITLMIFLVVFSLFSGFGLTLQISSLALELVV